MYVSALRHINDAAAAMSFYICNKHAIFSAILANTQVKRLAMVKIIPTLFQRSKLPVVWIIKPFFLNTLHLNLFENIL